MKKIIVISLIIIGVLAVLFIPVTSVCNDGGTRVYSALTYKIVNWNKIVEVNADDRLENDIYNKTSFYLFPNNFKSLDELWELENAEVEYNFIGTIVEINSSSVILTPKDDSWILSSSDKISFSIDGLENIGARVGDMVSVEFNGEIMESYPVQIKPIKWEIYKENNDLVGYIFEAEILEIEDNAVLVKPISGENVSGIDKITFNIDSLPEIDIKTGSIVKVAFNGQVMYSYPAQINATNWKLIK